MSRLPLMLVSLPVLAFDRVLGVMASFDEAMTSRIDTLIEARIDAYLDSETTLWVHEVLGDSEEMSDDG